MFKDYILFTNYVYGFEHGFCLCYLAYKYTSSSLEGKCCLFQKWVICNGYLEHEYPDGSPVGPVSVGPSTLQTESSGVRDGSASVTSIS